MILFAMVGRVRTHWFVREHMTYILYGGYEENQSCRDWPNGHCFWCVENVRVSTGAKSANRSPHFRADGVSTPLPGTSLRE